MKQTTTDKAFFISNSFNIIRKLAFAHFGKRKKAIWCNLLSIQMMQSHWLLYIAKNFDWSRKIMPLSNLTWASLLVEWKLTVKAELSCEIYKSKRKCWKSQVSFCNQNSPVSEKFGCCFEYCRSWKIRSGNLQLQSIWRPFDSSFEWKER